LEQSAEQVLSVKQGAIEEGTGFMALFARDGVAWGAPLPRLCRHRTDIATLLLHPTLGTEHAAAEAEAEVPVLRHRRRSRSPAARTIARGRYLIGPLVEDPRRVGVALLRGASDEDALVAYAHALLAVSLSRQPGATEYIRHAYDLLRDGWPEMRKAIASAGWHCDASLLSSAPGRVSFSD
jgi:hypothetical protein